MNKMIQPRFKLVAEQVPEGDPRDLTLTVARRSRKVRLCVCDSLVLIKDLRHSFADQEGAVSMSLAGLRCQSVCDLWHGTSRDQVWFVHLLWKPRFWNRSPSVRQLHRNEDLLRGAPSLEEEEMMEPRRLMRWECRGDKENRAILEALKMDEVDKMDKKMTSRRGSVQTMLHLVLRLAFLAQSRMNSCQDRLILWGLNWCRRCWKAWQAMLT